jgi:hypothetical protein
VGGSNGDRSENGDYIYCKKAPREIDRRIRFLIKRLDAPRSSIRRRLATRSSGQVFFGATVDVRNSRGEERTLPSSASTRSTRRAATSAGCRRWPARCSRRAKATR